MAGGNSRKDDPDTSREAAEAVNAPRLMDLVYAEMKRIGTPMTVVEIANNLKILRDSISPRMQQMVDRGVIEKDGERPCINASGRSRRMITWRLKQQVTTGGIVWPNGSKETT
jgi:hypothetical protein